MSAVAIISWVSPLMALAAAVSAGAPLIAMVPAALALVARGLFGGAQRLRRGVLWVVSVVYALALGLEATDPTGTSLRDFAGLMAAWMGVLSFMQRLWDGRGGSVVTAHWAGLGALLAAGFIAHPLRPFALPVAMVAVLVHLRLRTGALYWGAIPVVALAGVLGIVLAVATPRVVAALTPQWDGGGSQGLPRTPGFSMVSVLGTMAPWIRSPGGGSIDLRVWSARPPERLRAMVHDQYRTGTWRRMSPDSLLQTDRNHLEYLVFCRGEDTLALPMAWIQPRGQVPGVLAVPDNAPCIGVVVADTLRATSTGVFFSDGVESGRGWLALPGPAPFDPWLPEAHLDVPELLESPLDSLLRRAGVEQNGTSPEDVVKRLALVFSRDFRYDLRPVLRHGEDPMVTFLREKRGYCEHFATAGVLALRRAGLPARYVTGWAGPPEKSGGAWIFRSGDAHAWVEWLPPADTVWRTFDPTPPGWAGEGRPGTLTRWREAAQGWMQRALMELRDGPWRTELGRMADRTEAWTQPGSTLWHASLALLLVGIGVAIMRRQHRPQVAAEAAWQELLARAEKILERHGHRRDPSEPVGSFVERLPPDANPQAVAALRTYQNERFRIPADKR